MTMDLRRPPLLSEGRKAVLPPQYMGSAGYYAVLAAYPDVVIDTEMRFDKRFKSTHRCDIVDVRGPLQLTVAVDHGGHTQHPTWGDVRVSTHGRWWHQHRVSLESAYGRTPFFEYYIDRFDHILRQRSEGDCESVAELCCECDRLIRRTLGLTTRVEYAPAASAPEADDLRRYDFRAVQLPPYYQVRADRLGFVAGLSVLDLMFNMGPEAALILAQARMQL